MFSSYLSHGAVVMACEHYSLLRISMKYIWLWVREYLIGGGLNSRYFLISHNRPLGSQPSQASTTQAPGVTLFCHVPWFINFTASGWQVLHSLGQHPKQKEGGNNREALPSCLLLYQEENTSQKSQADFLQLCQNLVTYPNFDLPRLGLG